MSFLRFLVVLPFVTLVGLAAPAFGQRVQEFALDNGLQVVVIEDRRAPVVVHMVWYRVGAADEPSGKSGIAHYLEHLMFKGTDAVGPGEFSALVSAEGGRDNAFTSWDFTGYFQRIAADRLGMVMQMEADRMVNLSIPEAEAASELLVVLEERGQRTDSDPGSLFGEARRAAQFLHHPYRIPIIGWRHEIEQLTREDAMDFYRAHYGPNNAVLVVAGDVGVDEVRMLAESHYGPIPPNSAIRPRQRVAEPPQIAERRLSFADQRVGQPYVQRTYLAPSRRPGAQQQAAALTVLASLLGGNSATSVLGQALEFDQRIAVYTAAFYNGTNLDDSTFNLAVVPAEGISLEEVEAAMDAEIARFLEEGVDPAALARVMARIRAREIYDLDSTMGTARAFGAALTSGLTVADQIDWPQVLQAVTPEDVMAAARLVFDRRRAVTGYLMTEVSQ